MPDESAAQELTADQVTIALNPREFGFGDTSELPPLEELVGQERALQALDLAVGLNHRDYHLYIAGTEGTDRLQLASEAIRERLDDQPVPDDWLYVNNFAEPDRPLALRLPHGRGRVFRESLDRLLETLSDAIPRAFREEDFSREKDRLRSQYQAEGESLFEELAEEAHQRKMAVRQLPDGQILFMPLKGERPMTPEELKQLTPSEISALEEQQTELTRVAERVLRRQQEIQRRLSAEVRDVARGFAAGIIHPLIEEIRKDFAGTSVIEWTEQLEDHMVNHLDRFREPSAGGPTGQSAEGVPDADRFIEYRVNLIVDNAELDAVPVVLEESPNYRNLFGTVERVVDRHGRVTTNFTRIKAGSLVKANGGYLVFDLMDALTEPFVWKELKRCLRSRKADIEPFDPYSMFTVSGIKPSPIELTVRLIAVGDALTYHLLCLYDPDFSRVFRLKADFDSELPRTEHSPRLYGMFVRRLCDEDGLPPFKAEAIAELLRAGARLASHQNKVSTLFTQLADIARESAWWARKSNARKVHARHVEEAISARVFRAGLIAEKMRELIADGTLLIETTGSEIGRINGLSVTSLGDVSFGRPSRITASVGVGNTGIINIERESRLSGRTYDKGMMILEGYLRISYSQQQPLALTASLVMEQSYGGVDGDSASVAELLCLLSGIAEIPLRQDIAVTGSINQWGEIQAVGGVNEKIEGFFDACQLDGLTGTQGVCIPAANSQRLILRPDVVEEIRRNRFHVWAVSHIDQAIELLTDRPAGDIDQEDSFHGAVFTQLSFMLQVISESPTGDGNRLIWVPGMPAPLPPDPRPPLPGRGGQDAPPSATSPPDNSEPPEQPHD